MHFTGGAQLRPYRPESQEFKQHIKWESQEFKQHIKWALQEFMRHKSPNISYNKSL